MDGAITPTDVERELVEVLHLWRRSPGGGYWPFASDGPWHLVVRETHAGDWDARGVDGDAPPPRARGLTKAEVDRRDAVSGWLCYAPERDRALVVDVLWQLANGAKRPNYMALRSLHRNRNGRALGADGLRKRYDRALSAIAQRLNRLGGSGHSALDAAEILNRNASTPGMQMGSK